MNGDHQSNCYYRNMQVITQADTSNLSTEILNFITRDALFLSWHSWHPDVAEDTGAWLSLSEFPLLLLRILLSFGIRFALNNHCVCVFVLAKKFHLWFLSRIWEEKCYLMCESSWSRKVSLVRECKEFAHVPWSYYSSVIFIVQNWSGLSQIPYDLLSPVFQPGIWTR